MSLALWALVLTLGITFVAFLIEDLVASQSEEGLNSPNADWTEYELRQT